VNRRVREPNPGTSSQARPCDRRLRSCGSRDSVVDIPDLHGWGMRAGAIVLAKELNDRAALGLALYWAGLLAHFERNVAEVERLALELIELCTRQTFASWLPGGVVLRGWAAALPVTQQKALRGSRKGYEIIKESARFLPPYFFALKAEALHLAGRTSEALEAIREAEALATRSEGRWWCAEMYRLRENRKEAEVDFATETCRSNIR
jgi:hypothetical protein